MPPRFRRPEPMATFELVPDDERDDAPWSADRDEAGADRPTLRSRAVQRWGGLSRKGRAVVAAGTAVVVLGAAAAVAAPPLLDARGERLRAEAVRGLPGAVGNLSEPLTETWELPAGDGVVATFPGGLLLTTEGTDAVAVDAADGGEVWRRDLGPFPTCGPQTFFPHEQLRPADVAVCLTGEADDRTVAVLDADGAVVGERPMPAARNDPFDEPTDGADADAPVVVPAAAGAIAVVEGVTGATAAWPGDDVPAADTLRALRADGWVDPTLRLEDALTGEVRGEATLPLRAEDLQDCGYMEDGVGEPTLMTTPSVYASPSFTALSVCSASAVLAPDGTSLHLDLDADGAWPQPLPGGGVVVAGETSTVLDDDGSVVATVPGWLIPPTVDDDPHGTYLVLTGFGEGEQGLRLTSVERDGDEEWSAATGEFSGVLARVAGTVVVQDDTRLVGLDAATGEERWVRDDVLDRSADGSDAWVAGAVTDGTRLLLGVTGGEGYRLIAVDARDGATTWERPGEGYLEGLESVGGHPVTFSGTVQGLG
ncbi:hypothetical protein GCM10009809_10510 [Isoptericola hypogeus]|uniref:Pyrrolo-quinoline quinone repeat domain-containing protein n=1 Tax=Isoptericola hypogeus TaxID=300179 RepID=A0ABP4V6K8_9MICO